MKKSWVALGVLCLISTSCSVIYQNPSKPPVDFDAAYMNRQIRLIVVRELSAFKTNSDVAVLLEYDTTNEIVFPNNYNLRLFIQQNGQWEETKEKPTIRPGGQVVLSPNNPSSYGQIVWFWPQLDDPNKTYHMRVYVFGDMKTPEGIKQVAAFADFVLTP